MVECNDTRAAERDQTTWTVQTQPDKYGSYVNSVTFLDACVLLFGLIQQQALRRVGGQALSDKDTLSGRTGRQRTAFFRKIWTLDRVEA